MDNLQIAQEINNRIGNSPVPFDSVYSIALEIYQELGGEESQFDSVYSILLETLNVIDSGISAKVIDDSSISLTKTWSSSKIASELADAGFDVEIVTELPSVGDPHTIYFILKQDSSTGDVYDEWMYIDGNWEMVGNTQIDLSDYATIANVDASLALKADKTYVDASLATKQNTLTAGTNIDITNDNISADGYFYDETKGSFVTKYRQDAEDGGALVLNVASGLSAVAEGYGTTASGDYGSHAEGNMTQATGIASHAEGNFTQATAMVSHAEGTHTIASGKNSHTEGAENNATGSQSHAEGCYTTAQGYHCHAEGCGTIAQNYAEHSEGQYNVSHTNAAANQYSYEGNTQHSVGIGYASNQRKNAFEIMQNGDHYIYGIGGYVGTDTKVQNASIMTVQEVINSKADAYEVATNAEVDMLFVQQTTIE